MAIYFFDKNQDLIKIVPESATIEAYQKQELDEDSLLKDVLDVKVFGDEKLLDAEYMAVKSYEGNDQAFDMYRIVTDTTPDKTMSFTGMSLAPYELTGTIIQDMRPVNHSLEYTLNRVLNGTDWRLGYIDDGLKNVTTNFYYVSVKEALKELQSLVGCEFVFKVEISGQKITDKWVEVYREMGNRTKKRFNYGTNALTVVRETNKADIYTALIGRGKGEEVSSADDNESGQAGYGRKITFEDIEWKKSSGKPLDKPKGQYYLELPQATQAYGMINVDGTLSPRIGVVEFNDEEDPANLLRLTYEQLKVSARPKVLFKTTVANIGATGIGDTVTIHRHDLNMHYQTRVRKVVRNKLNDNKTQIELGDAVVTPSTKQTKQNNATIKNLKQELDRARQEFTETRLSADGKTNNHYGRAEPERKRTGDTWYRPHPSIAGEMQMLTWDGNAWELILDTSDISKVERELEEVIKPQIENMTASITEADTKADSALEKVDVNTNLISEHKKTLTETNGLLGSMSQKINSVQNTADGNEALIAKIQETPATYLADYQKLISRADLFDRTLGTTDSEVGDSVSRMVQTSGIIQTEVAEMDLASGSDISTIQTQLADSWGVKIKSADEAMASLSVNTSGARIAGKNILLDGNTSVNGAFWAKQVNAIKVNADNITTGQLDGSRIRANSIDTNRLTGNISEFIKTNWNEATGGGVTITGAGVRAINSEGSRVTLEDGVVSVGNRAGVNLGFIGDHKLDRNSRDAITMTASWGTQIALIMATSQDGKTFKKAMSITSGGTQVNMFAPIDINYNDIMNASNIRFLGGLIKSSNYGKDKYMTIDGPSGVSLDNAGITRMAVQSTIHFFTNAKFRGNDITEVGKLSYKSDQRLKTNIKDTNIRALDAIRNWQLVSYDWLENGEHVEIGLIAQNTPELMTYDSESDIYGIDAGKQTMINTLAIQQLDSKVDNEISKLKAQIASLQDELATLKGD